MDLSIANVINISVAAAQTGLGQYNTSNIALFTREAVNEESFGSDGYKIYLDPIDVATDFGTESVTYQMALALFAQKPNLLAGNGYLVIIPFSPDGLPAEQTIAFSGVAASGSFKLNYGDVATAQIDWDDTASEIEAKLRLLPGLSQVEVSGSIAAQSLLVTFTGVAKSPPLLIVSDEDLQTSAPAGINVTVTESEPGENETIAEAIARTKDLVQYFGILAAEITNSVDLLAAATVVQTLNKIAFWPQWAPASVEPTTGILSQLTSGNYHQNRGLFYGNDSDLEAVLFSARYASRALSTNFSGSNTTQTMHLKDLIGQQADPSMTQTLLTKCQNAGADVYVSIQGVAKTFCSGANQFFDQVYNLQWFVGALQVAGFNALAQTATKVPQTEEGVAVLKGAYRQVCEQAVINQYAAPGAWNNPTTFGNQSDFFRNISERGYYIYSAPVAQQSQVDREDRKAPLIQLALKEAGAIHSSAVIVYVNA